MFKKFSILTVASLLPIAPGASQEIQKAKETQTSTEIAGVRISSADAATPHGQENPTDYQLGPGDLLTVHVVELNEIPSTPYRVDAAGDIHIPVVGRIRAEGLTAAEVASVVRDHLKKELVDPDVTVSIAEFRSQPVSVVGAVANPGVQQLAGRKTLLEMIVLAGGIRPEAGNRIVITRDLKYGRIPLADAMDDSSGRYSVATVRVSRLINASEPHDNIEIKPHDVISIPRGELVYILGAVAKAGGYVLNENEALSALQIMSLAGGLDRMAAPRQARILRPSVDSTSRTEISVDLRKILDGKAPDVPLQPNDVLIIPTNGRKAAALRTIEAAIGLSTSAITATIYRY
jgi:polysaccharide export outer membrane protein